MTRDPISWTETRQRLRADRQRLRELLIAGGLPSQGLFFHPSYVCVLLHRISHYWFRSGHRYLARFFWHLNTIVTGADISEPCDLGPGLLIVSPTGVAIMASAGRNLTIFPLAGIGGEIGRREDVGAGPGLPMLGDDVVMEPHSGILGPVRIGSRARLRAGSVVVGDVPEDAVVELPRARVLHPGREA